MCEYNQVSNSSHTSHFNLYKPYCQHTTEYLIDTLPGAAAFPLRFWCCREREACVHLARRHRRLVISDRACKRRAPVGINSHIDMCILSTRRGERGDT